jgi:hypothetical protein
MPLLCHSRAGGNPGHLEITGFCIKCGMTKEGNSSKVSNIDCISSLIQVFLWNADYMFKDRGKRGWYKWVSML